MSEIVHFSEHIADSPAPAAVPIAPRGLSGIRCRTVQRVQCLGVCRALHGLPWYLPRPGSGTACPAACAVQFVRVRWGWGLHLWGIWVAPGVGWSTPRVEKIQKRRFPGFALPRPTPLSQNETHLIVQVSKNSKKYKKTPFGA